MTSWKSSRHVPLRGLCAGPKTGPQPAFGIKISSKWNSRFPSRKTGSGGSVKDPSEPGLWGHSSVELWRELQALLLLQRAWGEPFRYCEFLSEMWLLHSLSSQSLITVLFKRCVVSPVVGIFWNSKRSRSLIPPCTAVNTDPGPWIKTWDQRLQHVGALPAWSGLTSRQSTHAGFLFTFKGPSVSSSVYQESAAAPQCCKAFCVAKLPFLAFLHWMLE